MLEEDGCAQTGAQDKVISSLGSIFSSHQTKTASHEPEHSVLVSVTVCSFKGILPERPEKSKLQVKTIFIV